jgi:hypothetical protein
VPDYWKITLDWLRTMSESLRDQLGKSPAVSSLLTEQRVADQLRMRGWNTIHGFYYEDGESAKHREVDVAATIFRNFEEADLIEEIRLSLVVECKSGIESNIITTPYSAPDSIPSEIDMTPIISTAGKVVDRIKADLRGELSSRFVVPDAIEAYNRILRRYSAYLAHEDSGPLSIWISPPRVPYVTTAYRETSGLKQKEIDNSVLWRAFQSVYSAIEALQAGFLLFASGYVGQVFDDALAEKRDVWNAISLALACAVGMQATYHPVIVTHAKLWALDEESLVEIPQFRFLQVNSMGIPFRWVDVVRADTFAQYSAEVTHHYQERLAALPSQIELTPAGMLFQFLTEEE